jgi:hypothetical protein
MSSTCREQASILPVLPSIPKPPPSLRKKGYAVPSVMKVAGYIAEPKFEERERAACNRTHEARPGRTSDVIVVAPAAGFGTVRLILLGVMFLSCHRHCWYSRVSE